MKRFSWYTIIHPDWHEGQEIFEIDYWFPLPKHPDEPTKENEEEK